MSPCGLFLSFTELVFFSCVKELFVRGHVGLYMVTIFNVNSKSPPTNNISLQLQVSKIVHSLSKNPKLSTGEAEGQIDK